MYMYVYMYVFVYMYVYAQIPLGFVGTVPYVGPGLVVQYLG